MIDEARHALGPPSQVAERESTALLAVATGVANGTPVSLRCTEQLNAENLAVQDARITAMKVETVSGS